uniref:Low-density lipoprotein receptor domain class A n=1 Tax=Ditylenchus dipsaci TaxID=166011 RepID=A0A915CLR0_9BILA
MQMNSPAFEFTAYEFTADEFTVAPKYSHPALTFVAEYPEGEDENNCSSCADGAFHCSADSRCLEDVRRCDGMKNCSDGQDEQSCSCEADHNVFVSSGIARSLLTSIRFPMTTTSAQKTALTKSGSVT